MHRISRKSVLRSLVGGALALPRLAERLPKLAVPAFAGVAGSAAGLGQAATARAAGALAFTPSTALPAPPNQASNQSGEPQLRVDAAGVIFAAASNGPAGRTEVWRSSDRGRTFQYTPINLGGNVRLPAAAGDADLATAPVKNAAGFHNLYVSALSRDAVLLFTSTDAGKTWFTNAQAATGFGEDRQWTAAEGESTVYMSYRDGTTGQFYVLRSDDAGAYFRQIAPVINTRQHPQLAHAGLGNSVSGNLVVDTNGASPGFRYVYSPFLVAESAQPTSAPAPWSGPQQQPQRPTMNMVWMSVSTDGGANFKNYLIHKGPPNQQLSHIFLACAVDLGGNVYVVWSDAHAIWVAVSTDQGETWRQPFKASAPPSTLSVVPWITAGGSGRIGVAWYGATGTDLRDQGNEWFVYYAVSTNALVARPVFQQQRVSGLVYRGFVCEEGFACGAYGRNLFEDFGVAMDPQTGLVTIVYTDSQPTNTMQSIHTRYLTQTDGPRLLGP